MNTKYIFLDIDGTLAGQGAVIRDSARQAIDRARANGHKVFICSGRSRCEMHENILCVGIDGIVGSAGAYVEIDGKMIYHRPMTERMNREALDYLEKHEMAIMLETNGELYVNARGRKQVEEAIAYCKANNEPYDKELFDLGQPMEAVDNPAALAINKIIYIHASCDNEQIRRDLEDHFTVVQSSIGLMGNSGEISEFGMSKGNGISIVAKYFDADIADTIAIGDGENDMEMIKTAGVGIAMGNGEQMVKDVADYVTDDIENDGLYKAFEAFSLI